MWLRTGDSTLLIVSVTAAVVFTAVFLAVSCRLLCKRVNVGWQAQLGRLLSHTVQTGHGKQKKSHGNDLAFLDKLQFPSNRLYCTQAIGEGHFGKVFVAEAEGLTQHQLRTTVAVKVLKEHDDQRAREQFFQEMKVMAQFDHPNVLKLLAVCTRKRPFFIITEYMMAVSEHACKKKQKKQEQLLW